MNSTDFPNGLLTIAIPTYNRSKDLKQLLNWIEQHVPPQVEVVVSDNASEDDTWQVITNWKQNTNRPAHIFRQEKNMGIDWNILFVAKASQTEWFWWMGDDDLFDANLLSRLKIWLKDKKYKIIFLNYGLWNGEVPIKRPISVHSIENDYYYTPNESMDALKKLCETLGFISSIVVNKKEFLTSEKKRPSWINETAFDFVFGIINCIQNYGILLTKEAWIFYRAGIEPRGFDWIYASINILKIISYDNNILHRIKKKIILSDVLIKRCLTPRIRCVMRRSDATFSTRWKIFNVWLRVLGISFRFWYEIVPRLLFLWPNKKNNEG